MNQQGYSATGRIFAGAFMSIFGVVLLVGAYTYGSAQEAAAANPVTGPLLDGLSLIFMALAGVFIVAGLFIAARALRRAAKARQTGIGSGFGDDIRES